MGHGTPKSVLVDTFKARLADLEQKALAQSEHFRTHGSARPWHTPDTMANSDLLDVPMLHEPAWNRDEANRIYSQDVLSEKPGTQGDVISLKRQIDFMAVEERAWRVRHATFARCAAHAAGRLNGHGQPNAGIFTMVRNAADDARLRGRSQRAQPAINTLAGTDTATNIV